LLIINVIKDGNYLIKELPTVSLPLFNISVVLLSQLLTFYSTTLFWNNMKWLFWRD